MKKFLFRTICFCLLLCTIAFTRASVSAETTTEGFSYNVNGSTAEITGYTGSATEITIPSEIEGYTVTSIGENAFLENGLLTSVKIPDSVTSIGDFAFFDCASLKSITIPNGVTRIGDGVFRSCELLESITIPDSVTSIGKLAFGNCISLKSITIPDSVTSVDMEAFYDCGSLTSVKLSANITSIAISTFESCSALTSITIPDGVTSIESMAFVDCGSLTSVTIPNSVSVIGAEAFGECKSLTSVTIPNGVTSIGSEAFYACKSLTSVTIPDSVTSIGEDAFAYCNAELVIKGHKSSTAESYAKEENISFKVVKHTYEWVTTEEATYFTSGTSSYQCPFCGKVSKTKTIETLELKTPKATITSVSKGISVKYKKVADATGFQVKYTLGKKSVTKTYKSTESVTEKISGLKKGSYKVQVRAYVTSGKKKAYSSWTKAKSINVK